MRAEEGRSEKAEFPQCMSHHKLLTPLAVMMKAKRLRLNKCPLMPNLSVVQWPSAALPRPAAVNASAVEEMLAACPSLSFDSRCLASGELT